MPRMSVVTISSPPAISRLPPDSEVMTVEIEMTSPVTVRQATNMPAPAQASATMVMLRPPVTSIRHRVAG